MEEKRAATERALGDAERARTEAENAKRHSERAFKESVGTESEIARKLAHLEGLERSLAQRRAPR